MASGITQSLWAASENIAGHPVALKHQTTAAADVPALGAPDDRALTKQLSGAAYFTIKAGSPGHSPGKPSVISRVTVGSPDAAVSELSANLARARAYEAAQRTMLTKVDSMKAQAAAAAVDSETSATSASA